MRFVLDQDVDAGVGKRLRALGHDCWTAADAGLSREGDDTLTVYADDHKAVLITHDREFSQRRARNVVGQHIRLKCVEWEAADLLAKHLDGDIIPILERKSDVLISVSPQGCDIRFGWA